MALRFSMSASVSSLASASLTPASVAVAPVVLKFGGTSLSAPERILAAARRVARTAHPQEGARRPVAVVVSAMDGETDRLLALVRRVAPTHDLRELDAAVSTGENISAALLAVALQELGLAARSWQGWQLPILTDNLHGGARIQDIDTTALQTRMAQGEIAVVAGFQGLDETRNRITTLGRGGSDTTAVALASALGAERCDICTDVEGVYTADPRLVSAARLLPEISYGEMLELASLGAKVLQVRSVQIAAARRVRIRVCSSLSEETGFAGTGVGTGVGAEAGTEAGTGVGTGAETGAGTGTLLVAEDEAMEQPVVRGLAHSMSEARITLHGLLDRPGIAREVFRALDDAGIVVDLIVQTASAPSDGTTRVDLTFTLPQGEMARATALLESHRQDFGFAELSADDSVAKLSVVGIGMRNHSGVARRLFDALSDGGINISAISTSEIRISVLIRQDDLQQALNLVHRAYELDQPPQREETFPPLKP